MSKTNLKALLGVSIESAELLDTGYTQLVLSDGQTVIVKLVAQVEVVIAEEVEEKPAKATKKETPAKGKAKKQPEPEPEPEEEEDEDFDEDEDGEEEEIDIEEVKQALLEAGYTKKELKGMDDDELIEAYEGLEEEDGEEDEDEDWDD